jgi:hypothetical protein
VIAGTCRGLSGDNHDNYNYNYNRNDSQTDNHARHPVAVDATRLIAPR